MYPVSVKGAGNFIKIKNKYMDLKALQAALQQLETEKGVSKDKIILTIEDALSAAYKKISAKKSDSSRQIQPENGEMSFAQVKYVVDESMLKTEEDGDDDNEHEMPAKQEDVSGVGEVKKNSLQSRTPHYAGRSSKDKKERQSWR